MFPHAMTSWASEAQRPHQVPPSRWMFADYPDRPQGLVRACCYLSTTFPTAPQRKLKNQAAGVASAFVCVQFH